MSGKENEQQVKVPVDQKSPTTGSDPIYVNPPVHKQSDTCSDPAPPHHQQPLSLDQNNLNSSTTAAQNKTLVKRKNKRGKKHAIMSAESIPGHRGDQSIDDLVKFIEGSIPIDDKKKKEETNNN